MEVKLPPQDAVYVYQLPIRLWHWGMGCCVSVLIVTGYIIGKPWLSVTGEPVHVFYMGYTRLAHFAAAFTLIVLTVFRACFALVGNRYSRELFVLPVWQASWWKGLWGDIRWYCFLEKSPTVYTGHNPLAQAGMAAGMLFITIIILSGLGLYAQGATNPLFTPFIFVLDFMYAVGGNGQTLRSLHRLGMLLLVAFVCIHMYMVVREEILGRTTLVSTMFSGWRLRRTGAEDRS